ncbi:MAG: TIGR02266 family protein [Deltaproteobacteria bacterium]|nr:TIGR02266 family protein [Deltaproteobacteria bacterium]
MTEDSKEKREEARKAVGLLIRVKYTEVDQFVDHFATNISAGGIFIQSRKTYPVGTTLRFEIRLKSGEAVLRGKGQVVWLREAVPASDKPVVPGMGVRFQQLDDDSKKIVKRMLKVRRQGTAAERSKVKGSDGGLDLGMDMDIQAPVEDRGPSIEVSPELHAEQVDPSALDAGIEVTEDPSVTKARKAKEKADSVGKIIGIDLGTTNSCCAVVRNDRPQIIPSRKGYRTIPSIVAYDDKGKFKVGHAAKGQLAIRPEYTVYGSKRLIGRPFHSNTVRQIKDRFHYHIVEGPKKECAVEIAERVFSLQQVASFILAEIRAVAEEFLGAEVTRAVVTVPAYYNENQRQAVRQAGVLAGLRVERIVNEPTAAALAFGHNKSLDQRALIYDLGGGTFDASVMELTENVYEVRATGGDTFLGGVDFDNQLTDYLLAEFCTKVGVVPKVDRPAMQRLLEAAEQAKCALSEKNETIVRLPFFVAIDNTPKDLEVRVTRELLEELVQAMVERTMAVSLQVVKEAGLSPKQIDNVLLVGGQSRMPLVWSKIEEVFGRKPNASVHPDEAVAIGAALLADSLKRIDSVVLIDVLPMSIGIGVPGGAFLVVSEKGTSLPATRTYTISTFRKDQTLIDLLIFQGEHDRILDNEYLGTLRISGIPPGPKGSTLVELTFHLDQECMLVISAVDRTRNESLDATLAQLDTDETIRKKLRIPLEEAPSHEVGYPAPSPPSDENPVKKKRLGLLQRLFGRGSKKKKK